MVFSSIPAYLDPANWQQQPNHQTAGNSTGSANPHQLTSSQQQLPPPPPPQTHHVGVGMGSIRPGSMAERARLANIPLPEPALKCPRCESTNTKFCYFNNYSLSQPRHFCKTCRRYWTRGGALRNVPVGGGCRRNKRTKASSSSTSSKSPASSDRQTTNNSSSTSTVNSSTSISGTANILGLTPQIPPLRFLSPLSQFTDNYGGDIGLNYGGISAPVVGSTEMNFQLGTNFLGSSNNIGLGGGGAGMASVLLSSGIEQWRNLQQFPNNFLGGLDSYGQQFQGSGNFVGEASTHDHQVRAPNNKLSSSMLTQMASIKMEDNNQGLNLRRQLMGAAPENIPNNDQWNGGGGAWTDLSSFSSSSTSNPI